MKKHMYFIRVFITLITFVLLAGCTRHTSGVAVTLEHGPLVPLGGTMTLRAVVMPYIDGPDAEIIFDIPSGVTVVNGQARQKVQLHENEQRTFEIQVRLDQTGEQHVGVEANVRQGTSASSVNQAHLYLEVSDTGTEVRENSLHPEANIGKFYCHEPGGAVSPGC